MASNSSTPNLSASSDSVAPPQTHPFSTHSEPRGIRRAAHSSPPSFLRSAATHFLTQFPVLTRLNRQLDRFFTARGKAVLIATAFFTVGAIHIDSPVYYLAGAGISLLVIAAVAVRLHRPKLHVRASVPRLVHAGKVFVAEYHLANMGERPAYDLVIEIKGTKQFVLAEMQTQMPYTDNEEFASAPIAEIEPHSSHWARCTLQGKKRGRHEIPRVQINCTYPFQLVQVRTRPKFSTTVLVAPEFRPLKSFDILARFQSDQTGSRSKSVAAGDYEFIGSREYQPGLPVRRWDYRAWARIGKPHVREFEAEGRSQGGLVVDLTPSDSADPFEARLELAMAIAVECQHRGFLLDWALFGKEFIDFRGLSREKRIDCVSRSLALAAPEPDGDAAQLTKQILSAADQDSLLIRVGGQHSPTLPSDALQRMKLTTLFVEVSESSNSVQIGRESNASNAGSIVVTPKMVRAGEVRL